MIIDSQCHVSPVWYEPAEALLTQMDRYRVAQALLIQMLGQTNNYYQQDCLKRFPDRFASVVLVDPATTDAVDTLKRLADEGASGVRLRPAARSPGRDPLAIWRTAEECGMAVSCVGNSAGFASPEFFALAADLPKLKIVLEHLGGTSTPDADDEARAVRQKVFELAQYQNIYLKVPGLGELIPRLSPPSAEGSPFGEITPPILLEALKRFGAERLMWGSDFPPVSSREGYGNSLQLCRAALASQSAIEQALIFGGTAKQVFFK